MQLTNILIDAALPVERAHSSEQAAARRYLIQYKAAFISG